MEMIVIEQIDNGILLDGGNGKTFFDDSKVEQLLEAVKKLVYGGGT